MRHLLVGMAFLWAIFLDLQSAEAQGKNVREVISDSVYLRIPTKSQYAEVSQTIGNSDITISYFRPNVEGRKIWGKVVRYNQVWVAGAENATRFHFHDAPTINGQQIPKGDYAFFIIPKDSTEWTIIFNKNPNQHNTFNYKDEDNVLKMNVKVKESPFYETLTYSLENVKANSTNACLRWGNKMIDFTISFDEKAIVWDNIEQYVSRSKMLPDSIWWHDYIAIGNYCLYTRNKARAGYAIALIEQTFPIKENFENLKMKSDLLALEGDYKEAELYAQKAIDSSKDYKMPAEVALALSENIKRYQEILKKTN